MRADAVAVAAVIPAHAARARRLWQANKRDQKSRDWYCRDLIRVRTCRVASLLSSYLNVEGVVMAPLRQREDGRRQLLVYLDPHVIKEIKKAAVDQDRPVYEIAEEALSTWLAKLARSKTKKGSRE